MKLTKTEQEILDEMAERERYQGVAITGTELHSGRGSEGGRINQGMRRWNAVKSLIEKGLCTTRSTYNTSYGRNGYQVRVYTWTVEKKK